MAVIVEFKPRDQTRKHTATRQAGFTLLFFTGIRYERMEADADGKQALPKQIRRTARHEGRRKA